MLWKYWKPNKSLDDYSLDEIWTCYILGEPVIDDTGHQTGMKPPLRLVEQTFKSEWRTPDDVTKAEKQVSQ